MAADPSGLRSSMVCESLGSPAMGGSFGFASRNIESSMFCHPRGTRTRTDRLRSPQQIAVGAS